MEINKILKDSLDSFTDIELEVLEFIFDSLDDEHMNMEELRYRTIQKIDEIME